MLIYRHVKLGLAVIAALALTHCKNDDSASEDENISEDNPIVVASPGAQPDSSSPVAPGASAPPSVTPVTVGAPSFQLAHNAFGPDASLDLSGESGAQFLCKVYPKGDTPPESFAACDGATGETLNVHLSGLANGSHTIIVKAKKDDVESSETEAEIYVHDSLTGAESCPAEVSDDDLFSFAASEASMASVHEFGENTHLGNPFINLQMADASEVEVLSLRRHFVRKSVDGLDMVLMRRHFKSRSNDNCVNKTPVAFNRSDIRNCYAIAINADGRGLCMISDGSGGIVASTSYEKLRSAHSKISSRNLKMFSAKRRPADDPISHADLILPE